jgi:two-component sensor histidine kinase
LALIAHELVTNCVEHAFADGRAGRVTIGLGPDGDGRHGELAVRDDGRGFDGAAATGGEGKPATLGLSLVRLLAGQLGGSFEIGAGSGAGTTARVRFPLRN